MSFDKKSLAKKLMQVMKDCHRVKKDGFNDFQRYKYASSAAVLSKVNESLSQHGIATLVEPEIIESSSQKNDKGKTEHCVTVKTAITLIDTDSGETYKIYGFGTGIDNTDKAVAKAQTMAHKYAWMMTLNISTGDDPEADDSVEEHRRDTKPLHGKSSHVSAKDYIDLCAQIENASEYTSLSQEMKSKWSEFTKDEKDAVMQVVLKTKQRLGIAEKAN